MATARDSIRLLPISSNTHALLAIDGPASATFNTVVEAVAEGGDGNDVTLALTADADWEACAGTLTLTGNPTNAAAVLDLSGVSTLDTIVAAAVAGAPGNLITLAFTADGTGAGTLDESAFPDIVFHFEDGVTTITNLEAALTASVNLAVGTAGTGATVLDVGDDDFAATALTGGTTETVTIDDQTYTFVTTATTTANEVEISPVNASGTIDNLIAAVNGAAGAGTVYGSATVEHPTVRAYAGAGDTMVVHSRPDVLAAAGTLIATTVSADDAGVTSLFPGSWGATTLGNGVDGDNVVFVVTDSAIACSFADGFSTVEDFEAALAADEDASALLRVKTAGTTPLYRLVVTDDDFTATALDGGGSATVAAPTATPPAAGRPKPFPSNEAMCFVRSESGSGTMTASPIIWGWSPVLEAWFEIGALNGGTALPETTADSIRYCERLVGLGPFSDFACELAVSGTDVEVEVWLEFIRPGTYD